MLESIPWGRSASEAYENFHSSLENRKVFYHISLLCVYICSIIDAMKINSPTLTHILYIGFPTPRVVLFFKLHPFSIIIQEFSNTWELKMASIKGVDNSKGSLYLNSCNVLFQYLNSIRYKKNTSPFCEHYTYENCKNLEIRLTWKYRNIANCISNSHTSSIKVTNEFICQVYWLFGFITTLLHGVICLKYRQSFDLWCDNEKRLWERGRAMQFCYI